MEKIEQKNKNKNKNLELFIVFFKLGLFTIGGGMSMMGILHKVVVDEKKWLSEDEMMNCITLAQGMPGVMAVSMSSFIGNKRNHFIGGAVASIAVILPSVFIVILLSLFLNTIEALVNLSIIFAMLKGSVSAIVLNTAMNLGDKMINNFWMSAIAVLAFIAIGLLNINAIYIILFSFVIGLIFASNLLKRSFK